MYFYCFLGILVAQLLYVAANWWQYRRREYVFYFGYTLLTIIYFVSIGLWYDELKIILRPTAFLIYTLYFAFAQSFLETARNYPVIHRNINYIIRGLLGMTTLFVVVNCISVTAPWTGTVYLICSFLLFAAAIWLIAAFWKIDQKLTRYILRGALAALIGAFISNILMVLWMTGVIPFPQDYLVFVMLGIMVELFFFNNGLTYKSRLVEQQMIASQKELIEELQRNKMLEDKLATVRHKISRDLHDELGSGLSSIRLMSETALIKYDAGTATPTLQKIANYSKELALTINEIIWANNASKDDLESLLLFIRQYAIQYLEQVNIDCRCMLPAAIEYCSINGLLRRDIFLTVKEALHNIVKHAGASQVHIELKAAGSLLEIKITDNGKGFSANTNYAGNGLQNMRQRIEEQGGRFSIQSGNNGTVVHMLISVEQTAPLKVV